jgi:hypothetical protein
MTVEAKPATRKREPALVPVGYSVPAIKRRFTRPLHRHAVLEAAEAVFKPTEIDKERPRNQKATGSNC